VTVYVLDASAGADLLLDTENGRRIEAELESGAQWWVPEHYFIEVLSILRRLTRAGELTQIEADDLIRRLAESSFNRAQLQPLVSEVWKLKDNVTAYDSPYVILAQQLGAQLVSTDKRLRGAPNLGISFIPQNL